MGPQHTRCGKLTMTRCAGSCVIGFNGATTYSLWKDVYVARMARRVPEASMGPQHTRCGKFGAQGPRPRPPPPASMGPQHTRCGKLYAPFRSCGICHRFNGATTYSLWKVLRSCHCFTNCSELQWGHNILVVERAVIKQYGEAGPPRLQWGHNILVVESRGAQISSDPDGALQWGHNILVVESVILRAYFILDLYASMGPQHTRCGKGEQRR